MKLIQMPEGGLYRAGRWADVDHFPQPSHPLPRQNEPLLDGYRWEDSQGEFATAKASASAEGAIGRVIARYRRRVLPPDEGEEEGEGLLDALLGFMDEEPDEPEPELVDGRVPEDIFDDLYVIHLPHDPRLLFVDIGHEDTQAEVDAVLREPLRALGVTANPDLVEERDRRVTRLAMRMLHGRCADGRYGSVAGIRYPGQPDPEWEAYVIWSPPDLVELGAQDVVLRWVAPWDDDARAAANTLEVELPED